MNGFGDVLGRIHAQLPRLRPSERRVAKLIIDAPDSVVDLSITELAKQTDVSVASIARFCSAIGTAGYGELRRQLVATLSRENTELGRFGVSDTNITPDDGAHDVVGKIALHEAHAIQETAAAVDLTVLDEIADAIRSARRIDSYGAAASALAGLDLQQKLHRLALAASHWSDPHLALTSAAILQPGDVAVAFSHSGLTIETAHALAIAGEAGATTVAITNYPDSPLARAADHVLCTVARETRYRSGAMSGRMAQLAIVDFLFVRVAQRRYEAVPGSLEARHRILQAHRLKFDDDVAAPWPEPR